MASGAQLNRWGNSGGVTLLNLNPAAAPVALPGYGVQGVNDSGGFVTPIGLSKLVFQAIGDGTGYTVTILGTIDPAAYALYKGVDPIANIDKNSWDQIPVRGSQTTGDTVQFANPIVIPAAAGFVKMYYCDIPLVAVRAVLTATAAPTGNVSILGFAIP